MKNLFKNLMLVAVAAMAFTACTEENNEVNAVSKKTVIDFVASFADDTRSGFAAEKVDGKYVSKWDGGESITAVAHTAEMDVEAYPSIDEEGAGNFTAEFATEGAITSVDFYVPSASWNTWSDEPTATVPNEQTPRATSVDPLAHILRGSVAVEGNVAQGNVVFAHEFAYGKLTLNLLEDFEAEEVKLSFVGTNEETQELTLNVADLEENVIWFTTTPMSVASFTVEATAANGAIATKEATPAGALNFEKGKVTAFSVSELEVSLFDYELVLTKVTAINGNTISFEGATAQDRATIKFNPGLASIVAGTYKAVDAEYGSGFTSEDALEYNYNGSQFNLAAAYNASYDPYFGQSDIVVTDLGEGAVRIETLQKVLTSNGTKRVYIIFEGVLEAEEPEGVEFTSVTVEANGNYHILTFTDGTDTAVIKLCTRGTTEYVAGLYNQNGSYDDASTLFIGGYTTDNTWNGAECWPVTMEVIDNGDGTATFNLVYNEYPSAVQHKGTFTGVLEGLTLVEPEVEEEVVLPEFVIPGEGETYDLDYRYTKLLDGLDESNGIRVKQDNGWIWDIKFNPGLSSIVPGDYTAVESFTTADALEVDTYNGSVQYSDYNEYFYPDSYDEVSINVQQEGEFYCITLIGSGGYDCPVSGKYRLVYIGKIVK
jgi:hypothetical protein